MTASLTDQVNELLVKKALAPCPRNIEEVMWKSRRIGGNPGPCGSFRTTWTVHRFLNRKVDARGFQG